MKKLTKTLLLAAIPAAVPAILVSLIALLLNASGLELVVKQDIQLNRELLAAGAGNIVAGLRTLAGGEIKEYTQMLDHARWEALQRLMDHARSLGANAVVGVDFDSSEIGDIMSEILAYGTAVVVEQDPAAPQPVTLR